MAYLLCLPPELITRVVLLLSWDDVLSLHLVSLRHHVAASLLLILTFIIVSRVERYVIGFNAILIVKPTLRLQGSG